MSGIAAKVVAKALSLESKKEVQDSSKEVDPSIPFAFQTFRTGGIWIGKVQEMPVHGFFFVGEDCSPKRLAVLCEYADRGFLQPLNEQEYAAIISGEA